MKEVTVRTSCDNCGCEIPGVATVHIEHGSFLKAGFGSAHWEGDFCSSQCFMASFNWYYDRGRQSCHSVLEDY